MGNLGQKAYKLVLKSKARLEHSMRKHMSKKIKSARNKARVYIKYLRRKAYKARKYMKRSRNYRAKLRSRLVNSKYSQRNRFGRYKHVYGKYKSQQKGVIARWKRGVNRYMSRLFSQLKGICSLKASGKGKSKNKKKKVLRRRLMSFADDVPVVAFDTGAKVNPPRMTQVVK